MKKTVCGGVPNQATFNQCPYGAVRMWGRVVRTVKTASHTQMERPYISTQQVFFTILILILHLDIYGDFTELLTKKLRALLL